MGRRVDIEPPAAVLDEREAARQGWQLARRLKLEGVEPLDGPQFIEQPGIARRLAVARAEPDPFTRLALLQALFDERRAWGGDPLWRSDLP